jgi:Fic family protein
MSELFTDIKVLLEKPLSDMEVFYYASLIHLTFVHIHPFADGNGRSARLLEKWFLASKLGKELWKLPSEQYYKENRNVYYQNINLGANYYELDYEKCLPFLLMLPESLTN